MTQSMILISTNHRCLRFPKKDVLRAIRWIFQVERKKIPSLAIIFTDNAFMRTINNDYLNHDYATDVITFPFHQDENMESEIYINLDAAREQAKLYNVTYLQESLRLLVHGVLHLLGYDDLTKQKAQKMHKREDYYLASLSKQKREKRRA
jgi:rRNA maturation RNase YbeY